MLQRSVPYLPATIFGGRPVSFDSFFLGNPGSRGWDVSIAKCNMLSRTMPNHYLFQPQIIAYTDKRQAVATLDGKELKGLIICVGIIA
jgi:hypothetical protein